VVCLFQQALRAAKLATEDELVQRDILNQLAVAMPEFPDGTVPIEVACRIQGIISHATGIADPYRQLKRQYNDVALALVSELQPLVSKAEDPLLMAIRLAIAGNIVDFGVDNSFSLEQAVQESLTVDFAINDYPEFQTQLETANTILYLGDNTGEIVFDKLLVEELLHLGKQVTFAVRGNPVINDATLEDARYVGLTQLVEVITPGGTLPGTLLSEASPEFQRLFQSADLVISKGQGNFEGLSEVSRPIFFLLKAKCTPIAKALGVAPGAMIFYCPQAKNSKQ
jgi:uncharacterized protein with ATP-grasp and redox domains